MTHDQLQIETNGITITLTKIRTPTGERLAVESESGTTRLDALDCETLTWQNEDFYADLVNGRYNFRSVDPQSRESDDLQISNEYTVVHLHVVEQRSAVEVIAPKLGYGRRVDARAFAALVKKPKTFFSELLRTPYGPEH
jgi:hypothetical protein